MCRLFGLTAGTTPVHTTFWLLDAPDSLEAQSQRNADGADLGFFDALAPRCWTTAGTGLRRPGVHPRGAAAADPDEDQVEQAEGHG